MTEGIRKDIEKAAEVLKEAGAREVYLFGSVAEGRDTPDSDLDFAVSGIPPSKFFRAVGVAALAIHRQIDVVDLDEPTLFSDYLREKGKLLRVA